STRLCRRLRATRGSRTEERASTNRVGTMPGDAHDYGEMGKLDAAALRAQSISSVQGTTLRWESMVR
ncbi:MAG: hypothetical protein ACHREM_12945, partial [Polyangiales bacterium]